MLTAPILVCSIVITPDLMMTVCLRGFCRAAAALMLVLAFDTAQGQSGAAERVLLPGTGYEVILEPAAGHDPTPPTPALIEAISVWLSSGFGLPVTSPPPSFRFVSPEAMLEFRYRDVASYQRVDVMIGRSATDISEAAGILAVYDDESRTIYLREDWRGDTAAVLSIVVHEMVHHLQNVAGHRFECTEAREKQAFTAQEQWLALFGKDLTTEFGLDPFTLLVRTTCPV
jgi:hypothetical protein